MIDFHYLGKKKMKAMRREIYKGTCYIDGFPCKHNYKCDLNNYEVDLTLCPVGKSILERLKKESKDA